MYLVRAFPVWLAIVFAESVHGTLRQLLLAPLVGDFPARRIAFFSGMLLIFLIAWLSIRWIGAETAKQRVLIGVMWALLTLLFEFGLGFFVLHYSSERMLEDYDLARGGLMGFGLVYMVFVPVLAARLRASRPRPDF
jgi:hypothetical protein